MLNRVCLVGRLVADPEMKYTPAGVAVATMRIAVDRITKNEQGEREADFFNLVAWRRTAEFASNYLTKGRLIAVEGRLQARSWVAQDGTKRNTVEIVADNIEGLDRRGDTAAAGDGGGGYAAAPERSAPAPVGAARRPTTPAEDDPDEDPFADE